MSLGFGCLVYMTQPVEQVGPIRISYHFKDGDKELSKGCPDRASFFAKTQIMRSEGLAAIVDAEER